VDDAKPGPAGKGPNSHATKPQFEYRSPSILWEHRYLLIFFVIVVVVATVLLFRAPHRPLTIEPPPAAPVYVEPIPERPPSSAR
jgi:hypothetical protein